MPKQKNSRRKMSPNNNSRHSGVLLEHMDSKIDRILEGHTALDKKIDNFREDVDARFREVDYKFDVVFDELHLIRNELKEKVSRDEFIVLEKRVMALEKKASNR